MKKSKLLALFAILLTLFCGCTNTHNLAKEEKTFLAMNLLATYLNADISVSAYADNIGGSALIKFQESEAAKALFTYAADQSDEDTVQIKVCSITDFDLVSPKETIAWYCINIKNHKIDLQDSCQLFIDENILTTVKNFDLHSPEGKLFYALEESVYNTGQILLYNLNNKEIDIIITGLIEPLTTTGATMVDIWENTEKGYAKIGNLNSIYLYVPNMVSQHIVLLKSERSVYPDILSESLTSVHTTRILYSYDENSSRYIVKAQYPCAQTAGIN